MKALLRTVAIPAMLALASLCCCRSAQDPKDLPFRSGTIDCHDNGTFYRGELVAPTSIEGFPASGWVLRRDDGTLDAFDLAAAHTVQGHALPAGTRVFVDREGRLAHAWLPRNWTVDGHECRGGMKIDTAFHPDGSLRAFFPPRDVDIDGFTCEASVFHPVYLHPDGHLEAARLAADVTIDGRPYAKGDDVELPPRS